MTFSHIRNDVSSTGKKISLLSCMVKFTIVAQPNPEIAQKMAKG